MSKVGVDMAMRGGGLLEVRLDQVALLEEALTSAIERAIDRAAGDAAVRAVILTGASDASFLARARAPFPFATATEAERAHDRAARMLARIAASKKPVVAALSNGAQGEGLALALACSARVVTGGGFSAGDLAIGLPLAFGSIERLARLVGLRRALAIAALGRYVDAREAARIGLVDALAPREGLVEASSRLVKRRASHAARAWLERAARATFEANVIGRRLLAQRARAIVAKVARGHYPAPVAAIAIAERLGRRDARVREAKTFAELTLSSGSRALVDLTLDLGRLTSTPRAAGASVADEAVGERLAFANLTGPLARAGLCPASLETERLALRGLFPFAARLARALVDEAEMLVADRVSPREVDEAALAWGFAAAPSEVAKILHPNDNHPIAASAPTFAREELQLRLALRVVVEALRAREEGLPAGDDRIDLAAVYLAGFPPFRGGPLRYVDAVGPAELTSRLTRLERSYGPRFAPPRSLARAARRAS